MKLIIYLLLLFSAPTFASQEQNSIDQIKSKIISKSTSDYLSTIGNCPCPYNRDRAGHLCGKRSAWSKQGGHTPICYPSDINKEMINNYKLNNKNSSSAQDKAMHGGTEDDGVKIKHEQ